MTFHYIPRIISINDCLGNSFSAINLGLSSLDLNLGVLSSFATMTIRDLSAKVTNMSLASADWDNTFTTVRLNSATWNNVYSVVSSNSAQWYGADFTELAAMSSNWNEAYTTVSISSAQWLEFMTTVQNNSAQWAIDLSSMVDNIAALTANWVNAYTYINLNSANYISPSSVTSYYVHTSGDVMTGALSAPSLSTDNLYVDMSTIYFMNNNEIVETLNSINVGEFKTNYSLINGISASMVNTTSDVIYMQSTSANWQNNYTTVYDNSSNWQNIYATVTANSAQWAIDGGTAATSTSANWNSNYTITNNNSSNWIEMETVVENTSANWFIDLSILPSVSASWQSNYTTTNTNSAKWNSSSSTVTTNSAQWAIDTPIIGDVTTIHANSANWQSNFITVSMTSAYIPVLTATNIFLDAQIISADSISNLPALQIIGNPKSENIVGFNAYNIPQFLMAIDTSVLSASANNSTTIVSRGHGLLRNTAVAFTTAVGATLPTFGTIYFIQTVTADTFTMRTTYEGSTLLTGNFTSGVFFRAGAWNAKGTMVGGNTQQTASSISQLAIQQAGTNIFNISSGQYLSTSCSAITVRIGTPNIVALSADTFRLSKSQFVFNTTSLPSSNVNSEGIAVARGTTFAGSIDQFSIFPMLSAAGEENSGGIGCRRFFTGNTRANESSGSFYLSNLDLSEHYGVIANDAYITGIQIGESGSNPVDQVVKGPDKIETAGKGGNLTIGGGRGYLTNPGGDVAFAVATANSLALTTCWIITAGRSGSIGGPGEMGAFIPASASMYNIGSSGLPVNIVYTDCIEPRKTITPIGVTGNQTINRTAGTVNFAAGSESLIVTNSFVSAHSIIQSTVGTPDTTMYAAMASAGTGAFLLSAMPLPPTGTVTVFFNVF